MLVKDYLQRFGKLTIADNDFVFVSDGKQFIGGMFKKREKRML